MSRRRLRRRYGRAGRRPSAAKRTLALSIARDVANSRAQEIVSLRQQPPGPMRDAILRGGESYRAGLLRYLDENTGLGADPEVLRIAAG